MELRQISNVKVLFAETVFTKPSILQTHRLAKFILLIFESFRETLRTKFGVDAITVQLGDPIIDANLIAACEFSIKTQFKTFTIKLKVVVLEAEKKCSVNCLIVDDAENLLTIDIEYSEAGIMDVFIKDSLAAINQKIVSKIKSGQENIGEERNPLRGDQPTLRPVIPDVPFSRPYAPNPLRPEPEYPSIYPHIRIDPVMPPDIGFGGLFGSRNPPHHPDVPDMGQDNSSLMGRNHPYFNRKPNTAYPPFISRGGGFF